jgi:hypothetical protein
MMVQVGIRTNSLAGYCVTKAVPCAEFLEKGWNLAGLLGGIFYFLFFFFFQTPWFQQLLPKQQFSREFTHVHSLRIFFVYPLKIWEILKV